MHSQTSNIVRVRLKRSDLFVSIVIERAKLEVVRASDKPRLARDEAYTSDGDFGNLKSLDKRTGFRVVDVDRAVV